MKASDVPGFPEEAKAPGFNPATPARIAAADLTISAAYGLANRAAGGNRQLATMELWKMLQGDGALLAALMVHACSLLVDRPKKGRRA